MTDPHVTASSPPPRGVGTLRVHMLRVVAVGGTRAATVVLDREPVAIGRQGSAKGPLVLDDSEISRQHALVEPGPHGRWTIVGSSNLDPRSLRLNLEMVAAVRSRDFAAAVEQICNFEIRHSRRIRLADARSRSIWKRWRDRLAWSLRWWL